MQLQDRLNALRSRQRMAQALYLSTRSPMHLVSLNHADTAVRAAEQRLRRAMVCG